MSTISTVVCAAACIVLSGQALADGPGPDGKRIYDRVCYTCHRSGLLGAPPAGNKQAWMSRVGNGRSSLYQSALNGKNDMPPKGGKEDLTDEEVKAAVDYLLGLTQLHVEEGSEGKVPPAK